MGEVDSSTMIHDRLETALWLLSEGCSVFPLAPRSKKPIGGPLPGGVWGEFQKRRATPEEARKWFKDCPDANLALVCGEISGVVVVDVDGEKGQAWFKVNMSKPNLFQFTSGKHKFHAFFRHPGVGFHVPPSVRPVPEIDIRGDGSYVVIAPSVHPSGEIYTLRKLPGFDGIKTLVPVPNLPLRHDKDGNIEFDPEAKNRKSAPLDYTALEGQRNEKLTSLCGSMYARGCEREQVRLFAVGWNNEYCKPPLSDREVETIVNSMSKTHAMRNPQALNAGGVANWLADANGDFNISEIYRDLGIVRPEDKKTCQNDVRELLQRGLIETCRGRTGWYRKRESNLKVIDLDEPEIPALNMWLPFSLAKYVKIHPKNIIIVSGETNSGKSALFFNFCFRNKASFPIRYLTSELTATEIKSRMALFDPLDKKWNNVEFIERGSAFHDSILPDGVNIIDFLEVHSDFSTVGSDIKKIFDALNTGIVFIALQKKKGELFGRGGEFTLEKARLGLSLFTHGRLPNGIIGSIKITKAKNYVPGWNPDGKECFYGLHQGYFYDDSPLFGVSFRRGLHHYSQKDRTKIIGEIERYCKEETDRVTADKMDDFYGRPLKTNASTVQRDVQKNILESDSPLEQGLTY
jgi:hypothetical protein